MEFLPFRDLALLYLTSPAIHTWTDLCVQEVTAAGWDIAGPGRESMIALFRHPARDRAYRPWLRAIARDLIVFDAAVVAGTLELIDPVTAEPSGPGCRIYSGPVTRGLWPAAGAAPASALPDCLYLRMNLRPDCPFGTPPAEQALARDEEGLIDLPATELALLALSPSDYAQRCLEYLREHLFQALLDAREPGAFRWTWRTDDGPVYRDADGALQAFPAPVPPRC